MIKPMCTLHQLKLTFITTLGSADLVMAVQITAARDALMLTLHQLIPILKKSIRCFEKLKRAKNLNYNKP